MGPSQTHKPIFDPWVTTDWEPLRHKNRYAGYVPTLKNIRTGALVDAYHVEI